ASAHRRNPVRKIRRCRRGSTGTGRSSLHASGPHRARDRILGQGGRSRASSLGVQGGDRASWQGDRDGGGLGGGGGYGENGQAIAAAAGFLRKRKDCRARSWGPRNRRRLCAC